MSFHGNHGSNVVLSDNNKTATRKNEDIKINGVLFSSAPLQKGETFEVVLLKKDSTKKGGIEIGITSNNPSSFDMVRTMTDCVKGTTYMLSDNKVVKNGKAVDMMNNRLNNLQVNGQLGVRRDASGAKLDFLLDGQCQIKVDIDARSTYWAVVDLYGQAAEVAVAGNLKAKAKPTDTTVTLQDLMSKISSFLELLKEKSKMNFVKVKELAIALNRGYLQQNEKNQEKVASKMAEAGGAKLITDYLIFLRSLDLDEDPIKDIYLQLRNICFNYCDSSRVLAANFGKAGVLELMVEDLKRFRDNYQTSTARFDIVLTAFGTIHNCVKESCNKDILRKLHFIEVAVPFTSTEKHHKEIVMNAVMSMSYVMEENEASLARLQKDTMRMVLVRLKNAITTEDTRQADGWHAYEICDGLANLAQDFENLKFVVEATGVRLFVALLLVGKEDHERVSALRAIDAHTIRQSARTVGETPRLIELLMAIKEGGRLKEARELAASTLKKLEEHPDFKSFSSKKDGSLKGKMPSSRSNGDITIAGQVVPAMSESCQYAALCTTFFKSLDLMAPFFDTTFNQCYCDSCHKKRGDKEFYSRGDPPEKYGIPIGWYRFALMLPPKAKALGVEKKWHRAFHGTKHSSLSKILEVGELVAAGRPILGGKEIFERSGHYKDDNKPKGFDTKNVFLSPSIKYAGHQAYATSQPWSDSDGKKYKTQVAFQVFISPGCYKVGPQTVLPSGSSVKIDTLFDNSKLEWFTNQQGSTILYGLLVKVVEA